MLSDLAPAMSDQTVSYNQFSHYAGYGVAVDIGYANGNGNFQGAASNIQIVRNSFALAGAANAFAVAIHVAQNSTLNGLTIANNGGYVFSPTGIISVVVDPGSTLTGLQETNNRIRVI